MNEFKKMVYLFFNFINKLLDNICKKKKNNEWKLCINY